ncbi:MAG: hypothetical protein FWE28_09450, partial [Oscillospiraceae bacterium]|nr:hypothetical protein [Oscillospiraceae bacterium]
RVHWQGNTTRTTTLQYGNLQWRDLLTQINLNGAITNVNYDGNTGNPLNWHGGASLTWARGRQLQRLQRTGVDVTFTYDHSGIRTGKRVNRNGAITEHTFYTQNGTIVGETRRHPNGNIDRLEFVYDEAGRPLQLIFNGRIYNYVLNLQGDVQQIRRSTDGVVVATYLYNAWGQLLQSTGSMAESNPLRYRGYFYDVATGLYYLNSRYYDPVIGRFLNWDGFVSTGQSFLGLNMFAYCLNNPVNMIDPTGYVGFSTSGVQCWHSLNHFALMTGGSGNTTGWAGSPQQVTATTQVVQQLQRTANNPNLPSQQRINAQAQVYVLQMSILHMPIVLNRENPAQRLTSQIIMGTHQGDWESAVFRAGMIMYGGAQIIGSLGSMGTGGSIIALGVGAMFVPVPGMRPAGGITIGAGLAYMAYNAYKIMDGLKIINDALFRRDITADDLIDFFFPHPWR